jgi:hypothetical protein
MQLHQQNPSKGYDVLALQASERSRARSLRALLNKSDRNIQNQSQTQALSTFSSEELSQLPRLTTIQEQLSNDTVLLEYALGEERSYLWAVTATGISSYELPKRAEIESAARQVYEFLTVSDKRIRKTKTLEAGLALSQIILKPVAEQLGQKRLLIVGDGILNYIPFSALPIPQPRGASSDTVPTKLLLENHEIVNIPSAKHRFGLHRFGQGTEKGVFRWLVLSLIAYLLAHWAYLSTGGDTLPDWGESAQLALETFFPQLVLLLLLIEIQRLQPLARSHGFDIQVSRCKI